MENLEALKIVWDALHMARENCISEGIPENDEQWDDICHAMAIIHESLEIDQSEI
jgi:hypothetical protein